MIESCIVKIVYFVKAAKGYTQARFNLIKYFFQIRPQRALA